VGRRLVSATPERPTGAAKASLRRASRRDEQGRPSDSAAKPPLQRDARDEELRELRDQVAALESSLAIAEERLKQISETSLDIIVHFRPDGVLTFVSPASSNVLGFASEEMIGTDFRDYFAPEHLDWAVALFERALAGERIDLLEVTARHRDGHLVPLEVCAVSLVRDGDVIGIQGIARDVSKRKSAEDGLRQYSGHLEKLIQDHASEMLAVREGLALRLARSQALGKVLREREELLRAAFEQAGIGLALIDPAGTFLRVNACLTELLGAGREELLSRRWQDFVPPDELTDAVATWRRHCSGEITTSRSERTWIRTNGTPVATRVLTSAIRTGEGLPSHLIVAIQPIS
jgi:PAS domain S-box-containing protein